MKKILSIFLVSLLTSLVSFSQCDNSLFELVTADIGDAKKIKEFPVRLKKVKKKEPRPYARFSVSLKSGNQYRINILNDSLNISNAVVTLSDDFKLHGSSFDNFSAGIGGSFDYFCKESGTHYITLQFTDKNGGCAVGLLSFVDHFNVYEQ